MFMKNQYSLLGKCLLLTITMSAGNAFATGGIECASPDGSVKISGRDSGNLEMYELNIEYPRDGIKDVAEFRKGAVGGDIAQSIRNDGAIRFYFASNKHGESAELRLVQNEEEVSQMSGWVRLNFGKRFLRADVTCTAH